MKTAFVTLTMCLFVLPANAKYSGGTGEPNDPYQIATAADLIALGNEPNDYDKHFVMTADIDLDPNLPGRKVFDKAVIAADVDQMEAIWHRTSFGGVFDGNGHTISNLRIEGRSGLGLFGHLWCAEIRNVGVVDVNITGSGGAIGGLVGLNAGDSITHCYSTGVVSGTSDVGGLVGRNYDGQVTQCYSTGAVSGNESVGGLVGYSFEFTAISYCYSSAAVSGKDFVGGLVGTKRAPNAFLTQCYSTGTVSGKAFVGGLVGYGESTREVNGFWDTQTSGQATSGGGTGKTTAEMQMESTFTDAGWDFVGETVNGSEDIWKIAEGLGYPRLAWEKYSGGTGEPNDPYQIATAADLIALGETPEDYDKHFILIADIDLDPNLPGRKVFDKAVIAPDTEPTKGNLGGPAFTGIFDGKGHTISNLTIRGVEWLGLFGQLGHYSAPGSEVRNLGLVDVSITGSGYCIGGLAGRSWGTTVTHCYSIGSVSGTGQSVGGLVGESEQSTLTYCYSMGAVSASDCVGGLVGSNYGDVSQCFSVGTVRGDKLTGGLVGENFGAITDCCSRGDASGSWSVGGLVGCNSELGRIAASHTTGTVTGESDVGGLVGVNGADIVYCHSVASVSGTENVGGLVGINPWAFAIDFGVVTGSYSTGAVNGISNVGGLVGLNQCVITQCYSTGAVTGTGEGVGGLVGFGSRDWVTGCFWDILTSEQTNSAEGTGKTTAEMQTAKMFLDAGWDFVSETANGTEDVWKIAEGVTYPLLSWQKYSGGTGEPNDPYQIATAEQMNAIGAEPNDWDKHFKLMVDIDLSAFDGKDGRPAFNIIGDCHPIYIPSGYELSYSLGLGGTPFTGVFDGNCHTISHLRVNVQSRFAGLFDGLGRGGQVRNLGVVDVNVTSSFFLPPDLEERDPYYEDPLWSYSCPAGGLVGYNEGGTLTNCYSTGAVRGIGSQAGGLVGFNIGGTVTHCCSTATVSGAAWGVGGLVGFAWYGIVIQCYSAGAVTGSGWGVGALVGYSPGEYPVIASFWDTQTSGQATSAGGTGKTTAEMQTAKTFLDAGWDLVGETANGTEDIWRIAEGLDYPRLWWEPYDGRVTVVLGQIFTVTLESNPSTGYRWEWVDHQDSIVEQIGEAQFKPRETGDPPLVGAGGWESFDFKAVNPGQMTLKLVYRRPWEEGVEALKTFSLQVTVP